jgi:hypothetical protein
VQSLQPSRAHLAGVEALEAFLLTRFLTLTRSSRRSRGPRWEGSEGARTIEAGAGLGLATLGATGSAGGTRALGETGRHAAGDATGNAAGLLSSLDLVVVRWEARGEAALATESTESTESARGEAARCSTRGDGAGGGSARGNGARGNSARGSGLLSTAAGIGLVNVLGRQGKQRTRVELELCIDLQEASRPQRKGP